MEKAELYQSIEKYIKDNFLALNCYPQRSVSRPRVRNCEEIDDRVDTCFCKKVDADIEEHLKRREMPFSQRLFFFIDKAGIDDVECYKRACIDKKIFSKIKCNQDYKPSKKTAVSFALALRLNLRETEILLKSAGYALSHSSEFDLIIEYFIKTQEYKTLDDVNETLYYFDQPTLI